MTMDPLETVVPVAPNHTDDPSRGLSAAEVQRRVDAGDTNSVSRRTSRTVGEIVRANVFTRFNAIVSALLAVVLVFGALPDALFGFVMVLNALVGIVQELRAKRTLDALRIRTEPTVGVIRDGEEQRILAADVVLDDVVLLAPGDAIAVDGTLHRAEGLEVDESSLTGEADPVAKQPGDEVRSGSAVVAGSGLITATAVGEAAWANAIAAEARVFTLTRSELRDGIDRLLTWISWALVPIAILLFVTQTGAGQTDGADAEQTFAEGMISAVAGVIAMVPQGLVLLISMSMAIAVVRLARNHVVAQELPAVEGLARVDVICLDKTGTLTTGEIVREGIELLGPDGDRTPLTDGEGATFGGDAATIATALAWLALEDPPGSTLRIAAGESTPSADWVCVGREPFSSARKWSSATFRGNRTWVVGAPDVLLDAIAMNDTALNDTASNSTASIRTHVNDLADEGRRVLLVARSDQDVPSPGALPPGLIPIAVVRLREEIRPDAADTLRYFADQNVEVKIVSGDSPRTVAAIAASLGLPDADRAIDLRTVDDIENDRNGTPIVDHVVFGRSQPEQKRQLVEMLQREGRTVAMTGDGVNDIPALKKADIGIAMDTATPATKAVAQLILLDGRFDRLPLVIGEGRRVIANMERVAALFITKTVYATALAVAVGVAMVPFPLLPRHFTIVSEWTIGIPAFVLSLAPSEHRARPGFLRRTLRFAVPAGLTAAMMTFVVYLATRSGPADATQAEARTAATITLTLVGFWILHRLIQPLTRSDVVLLTVLGISFVLAFLIDPVAEFYALDVPRPAVGLAIVGATVLDIAGMEAALRWLQRHPGLGARLPLSRLGVDADEGR